MVEGGPEVGGGIPEVGGNRPKAFRFNPGIKCAWSCNSKKKKSLLIFNQKNRGGEPHWESNFWIQQVFPQNYRCCSHLLAYLRAGLPCTEESQGQEQQLRALQTEWYSACGGPSSIGWKVNTWGVLGDHSRHTRAGICFHSFCYICHRKFPISQAYMGNTEKFKPVFLLCSMILQSRSRDMLGMHSSRRHTHSPRPVRRCLQHSPSKLFRVALTLQSTHLSLPSCWTCFTLPGS